MSKEIKGTIEELQEMVLELHRSAAHLDSLIQSFDQVNNEDEDFIGLFTAMQARYRSDFKRQREYDNLEERERLIWQKLISNSKRKES